MSIWKKITVFTLLLEYGMFNTIFISIVPEFTYEILGFFILSSVGIGYIAIKEK